MVRGTCIICLQNKKDRRQPINLQEIQENCCDCDALVHKTCVETWYNKCLKCPICRKVVVFQPVNMYIFPSYNADEVEYIVTTNTFKNYLNQFVLLNRRCRETILVISLWCIFLGFVLTIREPKDDF